MNATNMMLGMTASSNKLQPLPKLPDDNLLISAKYYILVLLNSFLTVFLRDLYSFLSQNNLVQYIMSSSHQQNKPCHVATLKDREGHHINTGHELVVKLELEGATVLMVPY